MAITEGVPGSTVWHCPYPGCKWEHSEPPAGPEEDPRALADVFGPGVFAAHARNQRREMTEEKLTAHVGTHKPAEWAVALSNAASDVAVLDRNWRADRDKLVAIRKWAESLHDLPYPASTRLLRSEVLSILDGKP